jgi:phosphatidylglycerophosphate synthase
MIDHSFRSHLPKVVGPLLTVYKQLGMSPNQITIAGLIFGLLAAAAVSLGWFFLGLCLWWFGRLLDGTDGIYAREIGQTSVFGSYLDILCDMSAYGAMILGFTLAFPDHTFLFSLILFLYILCITTALCLGHSEEKYGFGYEQNRGMRLGAGLAEGGETGIAYSLFCLFPNQIGILASIWLCVLILTVCLRTALASREMKGL